MALVLNSTKVPALEVGHVDPTLVCASIDTDNATQALSPADQRQQIRDEAAAPVHRQGCWVMQPFFGLCAGSAKESRPIIMYGLTDAGLQSADGQE
jgi:hypothetical protein